MPNTYVNKVTVNGSTIIDLTADTVDAAHLMSGFTAHDRSGAPITGTASSGGGAVTQDQDGYLVLSDQGGGGGGSSYTLIDSMEVEASTTSTSVIDIDTYTLTRTNPNGEILYIQVRDKAGKRNGYFLGFDYYLTQPVRI